KDLVNNILDSLCFRFIHVPLLRDTFETDLSSLVILSPTLKLLRENPEKMLKLATKTISTLCGDWKMKYLNNAEEILKFLVSTNNSKWTKAILAPIWDVLTSSMFKTLQIKDEIDQGDAINHNFECVNNLLLFPFVHFIDEFANAKFLKTFVPQWKKIFCECLRCAGLTTSASANSLIEELCALFVKIPGIRLNKPPILFALSEIVKIMLENQRLDVSFNQQQFLALSPVKMNHLAKKSPANPTANEKVAILSSTNLLRFLLNLFSENIRFLDFESSDKTSDMILQNILTCLEIKFKFIRLEVDIKVTIEKLTVSFTNVLVELKSRNRKFVEKRSSGYSKIFNCMNQMLDSVTGQPEIFQFDTELLQSFEVFLNHLLSIDDPKLRQITSKFWNNTFGKCQNLNYPENLKLALLELKKREVISLPGISSVSASKSNLSSFFHQNSDSPCIVDDILPLSSVQVRSHIPATENKLTTFFDDDERIDEKVSKSESKLEKVDGKNRTKSKKVTRTRKRLVLEDSQSDDYVRIAPQQTKKRIVLTDHQKEKLLEKKEMPFLNNKENSRSNSKMNIPAMFATDSQLIDSEILDTRENVVKSSEKLPKSDTHHCQLIDCNSQLPSTAMVKDAVVIIHKLHASDIESMLNNAKRDENQIFPRRLQKAKRTGFRRSKSCGNVVLSSQNSIDDESISSQPAHLSSRTIKNRKFVTNLTKLKECNSAADVQETCIIVTPEENREPVVGNDGDSCENNVDRAVNLIQSVESVISNAKISKDTVDVGLTSSSTSTQVDHDLHSPKTDNANDAIISTNEKGNKSSELKFTPENEDPVSSSICTERPPCVRDKNLDVSATSSDDVDHSLVISVHKQNPLTTPVKTPIAWTSKDGYRTPQNKILNNSDFSIKRRQNAENLDDDLTIIGETRQICEGKAITEKTCEPDEITVVKVFSPASTPSATGILKRKLMQAGEDFGASPSKKFDLSNSATKKVHFAPDEASLRDDQFGIRPSPRMLRAGSVTPERKPKSLNRKPVSSVAGSQKISNYFSSLQSSTSSANDSSMISPKEASSTTIFRSQAVYPSLVNDETSVKEILPYLVSDAW
uniref:Telomere-associated protein RIF1 n=1 Tax=Romanomermis culicivorax TaxID=13658 RepID=A0A915HJL3_ROMCU